MAHLKFTKTITDPVHGTIGLTQLEADIISTPTFQRLHNVRQLGLAHLVFPGANYSRFAHSVGACHNAGRILDAIERNTLEVKLTPEQHQLCRIAGLLHDVGHYPFSHATEHIIKAIYSDAKLLEPSGAESQLPDEPSGPSLDPSLTPYLNHEHVGEKVVDYDPYLRAVFEEHGMEISQIKEIFNKESPDNTFLIQVISSDLDCDRLDYLRRTAYTSGLPYGTVDIDYIIDQACLASDSTYCFTSKALRATDHLLVSRYYDYLQVPFHKTVVALEWSLVTCIGALIKRGMIQCSANDIVGMIHRGEWPHFDDNRFFALFHELRRKLDPESADDKVLSAHLDALLKRKSAKLAYAMEFVEDKSTSDHGARLRKAREAVSAVAAQLGIPEDYFHVWDTKLELTKAGSKFRDAEAGGAVNILWEGKPKPLVSFPQALMHTLSKYQFSGIRIFLIDQEARYDQVKQLLSETLPPVPALDDGASGTEA